MTVCGRDSAVSAIGQAILAGIDRVKTAARWRLARLWRTEHWLAFHQDVSEYDPPTDAVAGVTFRPADAAELDSLADRAKHMGPNARAILAQQFVCPDDITLIGIDIETGRLVFHTWLSYEDVGLELLGDWLRRPAVSLRRAWVDPLRRGKGIATIAFRRLLATAAADGISEVWSFVRPANTPSLRLHDRLGFDRPVRICLKARLGRKHLIANCQGHPETHRLRVGPDFRTL